MDTKKHESLRHDHSCLFVFIRVSFLVQIKKSTMRIKGAF
jgi:hypothetical protein